MKIKTQELKKICLKILKDNGLKPAEALVIFNDFLDAELRGRECHGFQGFASFVKEFELPPKPPKILKERNNLLYIDGQKNYGPIVCSRFVPRLISKAKKQGMAMMGIFNMHSYLMPGTYARLAAEKDLIAFVFNYGGRPRIAPTGSIDPIMATNPVAIGIPSKDLPIVVDMATSKIAMAKVKLAVKLDKKLPINVALDKNGKPTTNPVAAGLGALLPFGEHRGSALALAIEILTKIMFKVNSKDKTKIARGYLFICFNPAVFQNLKEFKSDVSKLVRKIKRSRKAQGIKEIFVPGEQSQRIKEKNLKRNYLELDSKIIEEIQSLVY